MPRLPRKMKLSQTPFGIEWNAMVDYLQSLAPISGPGVHTDQTPFGTARKVAVKRGGNIQQAQPASNPILRGTFVSMASDYITLRPVGAGDSSTDFKVAKPYKLRHSITSASIDGDSISYTYAGDALSKQERTATVDATSELQIVVPRYLVGDTIYYASSVVTGVEVSGSDVGKLDINADARAWAKKYVP